jgi:hypothetical protein
MELWLFLIRKKMSSRVINMDWDLFFQIVGYVAAVGTFESKAS